MTPLCAPRDACQAATKPDPVLGCLTVFLDTAITLHAARVRAGGAPPPSEPPSAGLVGDGSKERESALAHDLPAVLDDLLPRALHCCHGNTWQRRLAGAAALRLLAARLPAAYVMGWAVLCARALVNVLRWLPEHCRAQREDVEATMRELLRKASATWGCRHAVQPCVVCLSAL